MIRYFLGLLMLISASNLAAHELSTAFIKLEQSGNQISGSLMIPWVDLNEALAIDKDQDGKLLWNEVKRAEALITSHLSKNLSFSQGQQACETKVGSRLKTETKLEQGYMYSEVNSICEDASDIEFFYGLIFEVEGNHKALVAYSEDGRTTNYIVDVDRQKITLTPSSVSAWSSFQHFWVEGVWHIWIGADHVIFLLLLLATVVLSYRQKKWIPASSVSEVVKNTIGLVTSFTIAHSATLTMAALGLTQFNTQWIEVGIAASIVFGALNNIWPLVKRVYVMTFLFGLLHGFGFASVMSELVSEDTSSLVTIVAFNLGIEAGQLAIIAIALPLFFIAGQNRWYPKYGMPLASFIAGLVGIYWTFARLTQ